MEVGSPGLVRHNERRFSSNMNLCKRIYPHVHNMDGFFVAKLRKFANGEKQVEGESAELDVLEAAEKKIKQKKKENAKKKASKQKKKEFQKAEEKQAEEPE